MLYHLFQLCVCVFISVFIYLFDVHVISALLPDIYINIIIITDTIVES